jgi:hypothetical protein
MSNNCSETYALYQKIVYEKIEKSMTEVEIQTWKSTTMRFSNGSPILSFESGVFALFAQIRCLHPKIYSVHLDSTHYSRPLLSRRISER